MTDLKSSDVGPRPARKAAARKRKPKAAAAPPVTAPVASPAPSVAAPAVPAAAPASLTDVLQHQTADSLQELSRNLAEAMTRANNSFSLAFQDQSKTQGSQNADPFRAQDALNQTWSKIGEDPENLREAHSTEMLSADDGILVRDDGRRRWRSMIIRVEHIVIIR